MKDITNAWDNKGDIIIDNEVWIDCEAVTMQGVTIGNGAVIAARAVVTKDVPPYTVVDEVPARRIKKRFADHVINRLETLCRWHRQKAKNERHYSRNNMR